MDIIIKDLVKRYGDKVIFKELNLRFAEGKSYSIIGPSGIGKSTLLKILTGVEKADSGKILGLDGRKLSVVFQDDRLCENLTVRANLRMICKKSQDLQRAEEILCSLLLPDIMHKPVRELSGGMRRRLCIARALLYDGEVMIFDEPFSGLDPETKHTVIDYLRHIIRSKTLIFVTHELNDAIETGSEIVEL